MPMAGFLASAWAWLFGGGPDLSSGSGAAVLGGGVMSGRFEACLKEVLLHEGGWSDHKDDPGGATMKGVTLETYRRRKPGAKKADLRAISDAELAEIYRQDYWDKVRGDDLPAGLDLVAFDAAVNSGPARGVRWLQVGLGVTADGKIGPQTIAAAGRANVPAAIRSACAARLSFLRGLSTWRVFGNGWGRRVASVERVALAMASRGK